jgi:glycosyltransferase involved in cell wall biosynthesis
VNPVGTLGGGERSLLDMLRALGAREQLDLSVLVLAPGPLESRARALGAEVEVLALPAALRGMGEASLNLRGLIHICAGSESLVRQSANFARSFRRSVARLQPDLVHTNGMKAHMLAGALVRNIPSVLHVRDFLADRHFSKRLFRMLQRPRLMVVANSRAVACDTAAHMPKARVRTIYNAIDLDHFSAGSADRSWLASLSGLPPPAPDCVCFGMVATYARWKGHTLVLQAAARLAARRPSGTVRFYVVGGPVYSTSGSQFSQDELLTLSREHGLEEQVGFVPFQEDVAPIYRALDVLVHPSTKPEPFGRSIVEAMATRCAVIIAKNGGALELFSEGVTALGFETGDANDLADKMSQLASSRELRFRLSGAAQDHVQKRFGLARLGEELFDVYNQVLGQR